MLGKTSGGLPKKHSQTANRGQKKGGKKPSTVDGNPSCRDIRRGERTKGFEEKGLGVEGMKRGETPLRPATLSRSIRGGEIFTKKETGSSGKGVGEQRKYTTLKKES